MVLNRDCRGVYAGSASTDSNLADRPVEHVEGVPTSADSSDRCHIDDVNELTGVLEPGRNTVDGSQHGLKVGGAAWIIGREAT